MLLRDLVQRPDLQLTLLWGDDRALDRSIVVVRTTDLPDPGRYLTGGELVLSGLVWHSGPPSSERFVGALAQAGVAALAAGEAAFGGIPEDLVAACVRHDVPLLSVPIDVSFNAIVEAAAPAIWTERAAGLSTALSRHRTLVSAIAAGAHLAELLPAVAAQLGTECWVLTAAGVQRAGTSILDPDRAYAALTAFHSTTRLPIELAGDAGGSPSVVRRAGGSLEHPFAAWCVITRGGGVDAVDELISLVELEQAGVDERRRIERRLVADLLHAARPDGDATSVRAYLTACGLGPDEPTFVIAGLSRPVSDPAGDALAILDQLIGVEVPDLVSGAFDGDGLAVAVLPIRDDLPTAVERLRTALATIEPGLGGRRFSVGISSVANNPGALAGAVQQATNMVHLASALPGRSAVIANDEVTTHRLLLAGVPAQTRQAYHDQLLGPLIAYDRERHTDLMPTLAAFLAASGSWRECAEKLHIHVNTLRYRLRRIEQLTGRSFSNFDDRVDLYLALHMGFQP